MKKIIYSFFAMSLSLVAGCSGSTGDFEYVISPDTVAAIKGPAISCLAKRTAAAGGTTPTSDISANYAILKGMSFTYANSDKSLVINTIEFKFDGYTYTLAGDALLALVKTWWDKGEAVVGGPSRPWYSNPALTYTPAPEIKIECPLYLGSLPSGAAYQKSGSATVYGTFEDAAGNVESAQSMGFVTITWRGD